MQTKDLTRGSIVGNILVFSLPYMLAYFLQILYGLADLFVIGQYGTVHDTTSVSNGGQIMYMVTVVIIGLAMGSTVGIAHAVGAGDKERVGRTIGNTFKLFLILSLVLTAVLLLLRHQIVSWVATPAEAVEGTLHYLVICFLGVPFIAMYNVIASVFRGMGDSRTPMYLVAVACVANIVLDYVFIGALSMGPAGAALGTSLSQAFSVVIAAVAIYRHRASLHLRRDSFRLNRRTVSTILHVGVPVSLQDGFIQVSFIVIMVIANLRGLTDAAAVGIVEKLIGLLFIVPSSMLSTVSAVSAQCIGAGKIDRARATLKRAVMITAGVGVVAATLCQFIPHFAVSIFSDNEAVVRSGADYLRSYSWDCALAGVHFCFSGFFTASNRSLVAFTHNVLSIVCARIPLCYFLSAAYATTLYPMGFASPAGSLLSVLICVTVYVWLSRKGSFVKELGLRAEYSK